MQFWLQFCMIFSLISIANLTFQHTFQQALNSISRTRARADRVCPPAHPAMADASRSHGSPMRAAAAAVTAGGLVIRMGLVVIPQFTQNSVAFCTMRATRALLGSAAFCLASHRSAVCPRGCRPTKFEFCAIWVVSKAEQATPEREFPARRRPTQPPYAPAGGSPSPRSARSPAKPFWVSRSIFTAIKCDNSGRAGYDKTA